VIENARDVLAQEAETGNPQEHQLLFEKLYGELRRVAQRELKRRAAALTLSPTTLLHETFLSIVGRASAVFTDNRQFISYAARAMRGLIIDYLRRQYSEKRGGRLEITSLPTDPSYIAEPQGDALLIDRLNTALESLAQIDPPLAELIELKYFCGLSMSEIAQLRDVSNRTVERDWERARLLLDHLITDGGDELESAS
jgi:RNA polymerase sigma factor (TIGR02999 family)